MTDDLRIGEYLRARRALVRPEDVGLSPGARRRVPGLRREELATLAGISVDYYVRLEQDRNQHPSEQVLNAIARALQLDDAATAHLHALAAANAQRPAIGRSPERLASSLQHMVDAWQTTPALAQTHLGEVVASNQMACSLAPFFRRGSNAIRSLFFDSFARELYGDGWADVAAAAVAGLHAEVGAATDRHELDSLVAELSRDPTFQRFWSRHDARPRLGGITRTMHHPRVGTITLNYERLAVPGTSISLVVYYAEPGSGSEGALASLAGNGQEV